MSRRRRLSPPTWLWVLTAGAIVGAFCAGWWIGLRSDRVATPRAAKAAAAPRAAPRSTTGSKPPERPAAQAKEAEEVAPGQAKRRLRFALVIDDLGYDPGEIDRLEALGAPLTYAVLPFTPYASAIGRQLARQGEEVLCHLPMQPDGGENPGPGALLQSMSRDQLEAATRAALDAVPEAIGANNHMGSELTSDPQAMAAVMNVLKARHLFFLDSRTSPASVGYQVARRLGVPALTRQVFLDDDADAPAISRQFQRALAIARDQGYVVAIGHPRPETLKVLRAEIEAASRDGVEFVRVSQLLGENSGPPAGGEGSGPRQRR